MSAFKNYLSLKTWRTFLIKWFLNCICCICTSCIFSMRDATRSSWALIPLKARLKSFLNSPWSLSSSFLFCPCLSFQAGFYWDNRLSCQSILFVVALLIRYMYIRGAATFCSSWLTWRIPTSCMCFRVTKSWQPRTAILKECRFSSLRYMHRTPNRASEKDVVPKTGFEPALGP